jgi:hypothetical protein
VNTEVIDAPDKAATTEIVEYTQTAAELGKLRQRYANVVWDCSTTKGDKDARSVRMELVKLRTSLDKMRLQLNADDQARITRRNTEAKRITGEIAELEEPVDAAIKAEEARREAEKQAKIAAEERRVSAIQARIAELRHIPPAAMTAASSILECNIEALVAAEVDATFAEFEPQAQAAKDETLAQLRRMHAAAIEREAEAERIKAERAELERLRAEQVERERVERARVVAEQLAEAARLAEQRRQFEAEQAAARAQQAKLDAEAAAERRRADEAAAAQRAEADRISRQAREAEEQRLATERAALRREQIEAAEAAKRKEEAKQAADTLLRAAAPTLLAAVREAERLLSALWNTGTVSVDTGEGELVNLEQAAERMEAAIVEATGQFPESDVPY